MMRPGKVTGPDDFPADFWKSKFWYSAEWFAKFFNQVVTEKKEPDVWQKVPDVWQETLQSKFPRNNRTIASRPFCALSEDGLTWRRPSIAYRVRLYGTPYHSTVFPKN
ncbi:unnamed protein product [Heligmosomoides polygyrus]|uniref:Cytoplasmic protein n=1 Tax=Heligmosomoides polygyrus TaxID=6339 RepID=A0A183FCN3_HELPZ|nr:unnamed protein product [Heligmosomoides polygyrus]